MDRLVLGADDWEQAVADVDGPQLVVAGPGTGKTEFLIRRTIRLVSCGHADPGEIVFLTFSRRAASDVKSRLTRLLGSPASGIDVSTFHSFAHRLLEAHGDGPVGTLLTGPEQIRLVSGLLSRQDPGRWPLPFRSLLGSQTFAEEVSDFLLRCQERLIDPGQLGSLAGHRSDWRALPSFFQAYDQHLRAAGRLDYGTLLLDAISLLRSPALAPQVPDLYRYVVVDEYQDTSPAQVELLVSLTAGVRNITVAGDPYQSIYSFRGADIDNIARFPERFPTAQGMPASRIVLGRSHRVPVAIFDAALRVTAKGDLPGSAGPVTPAEHAGRVDAHVFDQQSAEAEWIAAEVERLLIEERLNPSEIGVLVRSKRRLLPELSRALDRRSITHDKPDSRLVDHQAVRIVLDLTRAAALSHLDADAFPGVAEELDRVMRRILLGPLFTLPIMTEREILRDRSRSGESWPDVLRRRLPSATGVAELLEEPGWATDQPAAEGFWHAWTSVRAFRRLAVDPGRGEDRRALSAFAQALGKQADRDPDLTMLTYTQLVEEDDFEATPLLSARSAADRVVVTTLHQAKGLEFEVVFIADAVEGVFPDTRRPRSLLQPHHLTADSEGDSQVLFRLQEEMRLAYTAMTRARRRVIWTATSAGIDESGHRPSRFLLAAAGVGAASELAHPPDRSQNPVSIQEIETMLRRLLVDPTEPAARRLGATSVLAQPPLPGCWHPMSFAGVSEPGPDTGLIDSPVRLSPSQAEAYSACPRQYALERRLKLQEPGSPYLTFGSVVHAVLEEVERRAMEEHRRSTLDEAIEALTNAMADADFGSPVLHSAWVRRGEELMKALYTQWPPDSHQPVLLEHTFELDVGGVTWMGRADRIERTSRGDLRIVDYKTGATPMTKAEAGSSLQLGFYLLAARADPAVLRLGDPCEAELWYPMSRRSNWRLPFDESQLPAVEDRLRQAASGIAAEDWTPRVGRQCRRCPVRLICDRWPEGREAFGE